LPDLWVFCFLLFPRRSPFLSTHTVPSFRTYESTAYTEATKKHTHWLGDRPTGEPRDATTCEKQLKTKQTNKRINKYLPPLTHSCQASHFARMVFFVGTSWT